MAGRSPRPPKSRFGHLADLFSGESLLAILLLGVVPSLHALDLAVSANPNPVAVGAPVTIDVTFAYPDASSVSTDPLALPKGLAVVSGPDVRPYVDESNPEASEVRVTFEVEADAPGRYAIPPVIVHAGALTAATSPFVLAVGLHQGGRVVVPLVLRWRPLLSPLYAGETVPIALEIENEPSMLTVDSVSIVPPPGAFVAAGALLSPQTVEVGGATLYTIPAAVYEYTLPSAGSVTIPAATVRCGERSGSADPLTLEVLPDPPDIASSGAIGSLSYTATVEAVGRSDAVSLRLRVEGDGNLDYLRLPEPETTNVVTVGDEERKSFQPTLKGESGYRERTYRFLAEGEAAASVRIPAFSWLDPFSGKVHQVPGRLISLSPTGGAGASGAAGARVAPGNGPAGSTPPQGGEGSVGTAASVGKRGEGAAGSAALTSGGSSSSIGTAGGAPPFGPEPWVDIEGSSFRDLAARPLDYLWFLPGPLFLAIALIGRRRIAGAAAALLLISLLLGFTPQRVSKLEPIATKALADYDGGRLKEALAGFEAGLSIEPKNAALYFNEGLAEYRLGLYGYAVGSARSAIYWSPTSARYRSLLNWMIGRLSIPEQVAPAVPLDPNLFFLGLVLFFNGACAGAGLFLLTKKAGWVILLGLCSVLAVGCAGGFLYTLAARSMRTAVVAEAHTELRKIPVDSATHWMDLSQGMAVRLLGDAAGYDLIETGYGIKGWVKKGGLLPDGAPHRATEAAVQGAER